MRDLLANTSARGATSYILGCSRSRNTQLTCVQVSCDHSVYLTFTVSRTSGSRHDYCARWQQRAVARDSTRQNPFLLLGFADSDPYRADRYSRARDRKHDHLFFAELLRDTTDHFPTTVAKSRGPHTPCSEGLEGLDAAPRHDVLLCDGAVLETARAPVQSFRLEALVAATKARRLLPALLGREVTTSPFGIGVKGWSRRRWGLGPHWQSNYCHKCRSSRPGLR